MYSISYVALLYLRKPFLFTVSSTVINVSSQSKIMFFSTFSGIDVSLLAIKKTNAFFIGNGLTLICEFYIFEPYFSDQT